MRFSHLLALPALCGLLGCTTSKINIQTIPDAIVMPPSQPRPGPTIISHPPGPVIAAYIVRPGDTLSAIANRFSDYDSYQEIIGRNNIQNSNSISVGQKLWIIQAYSRNLEEQQNKN